MAIHTLICIARNQCVAIMGRLSSTFHDYHGFLVIHISRFRSVTVRGQLNEPLSEGLEVSEAVWRVSSRLPAIPGAVWRAGLCPAMSIVSFVCRGAGRGDGFRPEFFAELAKLEGRHFWFRAQPPDRLGAAAVFSLIYIAFSKLVAEPATSSPGWLRLSQR
jgi:hypothetical protein